jgi:integrase
MKMRRAHLVPLSTQALDLLNELKIMTGNYRYVFPGRNDPNKPMSEASINQVIKRIGYGGKVTGHGFRHSLSTILMKKDTIRLGLKCSLLIQIKIISEVLIIMLNILSGARI